MVVRLQNYCLDAIEHILLANMLHVEEPARLEHQKSRRGKQHKKEVIEFEVQLSRNLWALHYDLKYRRYRIGEYRKH